MEDTINLKDVLQVLKKRFVLIFMSMFIAALSSGLITYFFITPTYQSSTQLLINQTTKGELLDPNQVRTNIELSNTYFDIINSPKILNKVVNELNLDLSIMELSNQVTITKADNSQIIEISVESDNPSLAVSIADGVAKAFQQEISSIMKVNNVHVLYGAKENPNPVKPDMLINVMVALLLGLCCGIGLAFLLEYLDTTIKSEKDIGESLGISVVGHIFPIKPIHKKVKNKEVQNHMTMGGQKIESQ